ncbi:MULTISPECIES: biofilm formation regulator HmsP [Pantoea]|uniref:biofilm formation regulator HmsP n=1 Tax=Pantoea TaxID=53335 RepID=UPI000397C256|nr:MULTISPECIES: biofilm formation regulator HmsP [Pantoea]ERH65818.1 biofilm formation regulator HmsP [Pantoea dispersa EGD-AAK13]KAF0854995.1 biofilm formation regulator HmsP [Pantoea dispersa 625]MBS0899349.1 biofilm formation regulator HmsP [Pantoea dispersa]MBS0906302.1 biofilm formation regulator HmsP [Pantoea dispersa]MBU6518948.1 biofilm formation regulator HmsP [Pantoea sp. B270]
MRVSRSLTIKQMATVSAVALVTICIFIVIQLFHFVQQRRVDYAQQMENVAHTVRQPLSEAVLKADIPQAERILNTLKPAGILSRADVVLPNAFQALHADFAPEKPVPRFVARLFELPVQITLPLYSVERSGLPKPIAYLVLQADSSRVYQFLLSTLSTMITTYLLLALILSVAISWCINRLIVHPLRNISRELQELPPPAILTHKLALPHNHRDDEIGMLIRSYNRNQQVLESIHDEMSRLTTHFAVTDLPNRALFLALLDQHIRHRHSQQPWGLMVIRIETLQEANGVLSDEQRDTLMLTLVEKIRSTIDDHTLLAQTGPSDFALLMKRAHNPFRAMRLARNLMLRINQPVNLYQLQLRPNASIGLALHDDNTVSAGEQLARATSAMMSARHQGKNQILFFDPALTERAQKRLTQEHDILQGLQDGQFALYLQPQINMATGELAGAEALLRMRMPDGSYGLSEEFIASAEEIGVISALGRWVFEEACRIIAGWQRHGINLPLSVNISAVQLRDASVVSHLQGLLERHRIAPGNFVLEITETAQIGDAEQAMALLRSLQQTGVAVALDDFGMGYSNLNYLHQFKALPVNKLKMDRSFVAALPDDDTMVRIVAAIADIIHLDVIAEGVETAEQRDWLLARGITIGQGYLYAEALPLSVFNQRWLASSSPSE